MVNIDPKYVRTEFELHAVFKHRNPAAGETIFKDIVSMSATFALNAIPTAALEVATGLEVRSGKNATIHDVIDKLEPRDRCIVYLTIRSTDGRLNGDVKNGMKDGTFIVFDGYYAGIGYRRADNHCTYNIHLIHWLDDLNCSSMLNGDWSPNASGDLAQAASSIALSDLSGGNSGAANADNPKPAAPGTFANPTAIPLIDRGTGKGLIVNSTSMEEDLWENVIKKIFTAICELQHPGIQCNKNPVSANDPPPADAPGADSLLMPSQNNRAALQALQRMPGKAPEKFRAKLPLNLAGFSGDKPSEVINIAAERGLTGILTNNLGYNSFWSKLVGEVGPSFLFAISPSVDFAQAIPFFPGLSTPYVEITGEEYNYANFNTNCAHMISALLLYWPVSGSGSGLPVTRTDLAATMSYCTPAGFYPQEQKDYEHHWGTILVRTPPTWLSPDIAMMYSRQNHFNYQGRSVYDPKKGSEENTEAPQSAKKVVETYARDSKTNVDGQNLNIYDRFACHWYKSAMLGQRYGELSGKLRFDIAPGSIVKILPPVTAINKENTEMYGAVVQVAFTINAEQHTAGTSFALSHVRTHHENDVQIESSRTHYVGQTAPVYKNDQPGSPWPGGPLVSGQEPESNAASAAPIDSGGVTPNIIPFFS